MKIKAKVRHNQMKAVLMTKNDLVEETKVKEIAIEIEKSNTSQGIGKEKEKRMIREARDQNSREIEKGIKGLEIVIEIEEKTLETTTRDQRENLMIDRNQKTRRDRKKDLETKSMNDPRINNATSVNNQEKNVDKEIVNQMGKVNLEIEKIVKTNRRIVVLKQESKKKRSRK